MNVGAVVVSYNSANSLAGCLRSLRESSVADVVVVDNASSDSSVEMARSLKMKVVSEKTNRGFAYACNRGVEKLQTDFILFINPDTCIDRGATEMAVKTASSDDSIGVVGMLLVSPQGEPQKDNYGGKVNLISLFGRHFLSTPTPKFPQDVDWVSGGAIVVRRSAWEGVGGFDERYFMYWEDVDFCRLVKASGGRVIIDPNARVFHTRGSSLPDQRRKTLLYDASADKYFHKHYATPIWLLHRFLRRIYRWLRPQAQ